MLEALGALFAYPSVKILNVSARVPSVIILESKSAASEVLMFSGCLIVFWLVLPLVFHGGGR
jgi:hypothetical protein